MAKIFMALMPGQQVDSLFMIDSFLFQWIMKVKDIGGHQRVSVREAQNL